MTWTHMWVVRGILCQIAAGFNKLINLTVHEKTA